MRIEKNINCHEIPIVNIRDGECFIYKDKLHMRVNIGSIARKNESDFPVVIVNLENNKLNALKDWVTVKKVDARIVVE